VTGFGLVIANFVLSLIENTKHVNDDLQPVYRLFPAFCLGDCFYKLATRQALAAILGPAQAAESLFSSKLLGAPLFNLFAEGIIFGLLTLLLQYNEATPIAQLLLGLTRRALGRPKPPVFTPSSPLFTPEPPLGSLEDDSVVAERAAVDAGDTGAKLVLSHLRKVYGGLGGKVAVRDLVLRIREGECFGFLGTNGAGKSTTFSMLTGAVVPTSGDATLDGLSIRREQARDSPCV